MALHPIYGFHGCSRADAESILLSSDLKKSSNDFEWLGEGFYFWEDFPQRALDWAIEKKRENPTVLGAIIDPDQCLDLASPDGAELLRLAHRKLKEIYALSGKELPKNESGRRGDHDEIKRRLDCAVVNTLFADSDIPAVKSAFIEGRPVYPDGKFYEKTHTQICVRNPSCILGLFVVRDLNAWKEMMSFAGRSK